MSVDQEHAAANGKTIDYGRYRPAFAQSPPVEGRIPEQGTAPGCAPRTVTGRRKVAIIGFTNSAAEAPYGDDEWEIWGMNALHCVVREPHGTVLAWNVPQLLEQGAFHLWVDGHDTDDQLPAEQRAWLAADHPFPRFTAVDVEGCDLFPAQAVMDWAAASGLAVYFTSTVAWELAWALMQLDGVEGAELGLWGVDMAVGTEYEQQRPCVEYWVGVAHARGVPVRIPETSDILSTEGIYGFGMGRADPLMTKIIQRRDETAGICRQTEQAIAQLEQQLAQARDQLMAHRGAHELAQNLVRTRSHARTGGAVSAQP